MANIASPDLSVFGNIKTVNDFQRLNEEFALKKQLAQAQLQKANQFDIDQVGQQAFIKAANGMPLSPTEQASLQYLDSKQQTMAFNPVTGALEQKPGLLDRAGIGSAQPSRSAPQPAPAINPGSNFATQTQPAVNQGATGDFLADVAPAGGAVPMAPVTQENPWDAEYQAQRANLLARKDLRAVHDLDVNYSKSKIAMNESESKNAGFADRVAASNPLIEKYTSAGTDFVDSRLEKNLPDFIANRVVSDDYQSFNQAQRDFINAQLRRESGAVISPGEFSNAALQYFPQSGDSAQVLLQKKANRQNALQALQRSAGPAYKPAPAIEVPQDNPLQQEFDAKRGNAKTSSGIPYRIIK